MIEEEAVEVVAAPDLTSDALLVGRSAEQTEHRTSVLGGESIGKPAGREVVGNLLVGMNMMMIDNVPKCSASAGGEAEAGAQDGAYATHTSDEDKVPAQSAGLHESDGLDGVLAARSTASEKDTLADLPPIFEIAGVDSSNDSLPDAIMQQQLQETQHKNLSPFGSFLHSERQTRLRKASADSDFEMRQLDQQLALTQQYTNEVFTMRREQSKLEEMLKEEKQEIALRNAQLVAQLQKLAVSKAEISQAEAEVAILINEYNTQLLLLEQEKSRLWYGIMNTMQPSAAHQAGENVASAIKPPVEPPVDVPRKGAENESMPQLTASTNSSEETTVPVDANSPVAKVPMIQCKTRDGSTKKVPIYSKGMTVYYKDTSAGTEIPAIIAAVHVDDLLEPYYTIRFEDGREKQTDNAHIRVLEIGMLTGTAAKAGPADCAVSPQASGCRGIGWL